MRRSYITSFVIALFIGGWLYSGDHSETVITTTLAEINRTQARVNIDRVPTQVRVAVLDATEQPRLVKVRGKTNNKRTVKVKAELTGTITHRPVQRGSQVKSGDLLCRISTEDRRASLREAAAVLYQARIDYKGALRLKQEGFNSQSAIATAQARLATAKANLQRKELDLGKLEITAPFGGIVDDVPLEVGDYAAPGQPCATIIDLEPMLLTGRVSERYVTKLAQGQKASGTFRDGKTVTGSISFIGHQSDNATRTYPIEIELPNPNYTIRSGITTEIRIPVESVAAQLVSPALFGLDDTGNIGIRTIDSDNIVEFHLIDVLADASDGVWVTGLPGRAKVIVVGQELVVPGERVDPIFVTEPRLTTSSMSAVKDEMMPAATTLSGR